MALSSQIDAAAKRPRKPIDPDKLNLESPVLSITRRHRDEEQAERQRAIACVRRMAPDHAEMILDVLGLAEPAPAPVVPEPTVRECTRCRETKHISEFKHPIEARLTTQCAACRKKFYRPNSLKRKGTSQ